MLPGDWSEDRGPRLLDLPSDLEDLFETYLRALHGGSLFERVVLNAIAAGADQVLVERSYIDADYRSEFANFYAETYRPLPDRCHRLHFLSTKEREYFGYIVMRPILGRPVSRTMLAPPPLLAPHVSCLASGTASPYGAQFDLSAFPFISQDYQYGRCAHAAIWMVALYFHLAFRRPRFHMSDIVAAAREPAYAFRQTPSNGLTHPQINAALEALGMPAINYILEEPPRAETPETIACRYLNSRLPVIVLGGNHARVLIGYGVDRGGHLFFICHDDARGPYRAIGEPGTGSAGRSEEAGKWERLVVPMPGRVYLTGEAAEREGGLALGRELRKHEDLAPYVRALERGDLRLRTYVTTIVDYIQGLRLREVSGDLMRWHARVGASHWVWVVELQDRDAAARGSRCVIGEVVVDATSDDLEPNFLSANLPGYLMRWAQLGAPTQTRPGKQVELYESGCALHVSPPPRSVLRRNRQRLLGVLGRRRGERTS